MYSVPQSSATWLTSVYGLLTVVDPLHRRSLKVNNDIRSPLVPQHKAVALSHVLDIMQMGEGQRQAQVPAYLFKHEQDFLG